jgi:hypothetical protein
MPSRREFLEQISVGTISTALYNNTLFGIKASINKHIHVKETNFTLSAITPSVVGFLYTDFPEKVEKHINVLRLKNHYRKTFSFRSTDKYKLSFAKDLIDYFFSEPSLYFYSRIVDDIPNLKRDDVTLIHDIAYRVNYRKAITDLKEFTNADIIYLDFITRLPRKNGFPTVSSIEEVVPYINFKTSKKQLVRYLNSHIQMTDLRIEPHNRSNLSQMVDFFTGNIYGDVIGIENKTKKQLLDYLKNKLGVKKISELYNSNRDEKFVVSSIHK